MLESSFTNHFSKLEDPRVTNHNTRHKFIEILVLAFVAILCGCDDWREVEEFCKRKVASWDEEYLFNVLSNGLKLNQQQGL